MDEGGGGEKNITWPRLHSQVNAQLKKLHPRPCLKKSRVHSCIYNTHTCKCVCKSESSLSIFEHLWCGASSSNLPDLLSTRIC
jgi:hypothetical protein